MKVEFRCLKEGRAYIELQPENPDDQDEQEVLKQIYQAGFASGSGILRNPASESPLFCHLCVIIQKQPRP